MSRVLGALRLRSGEGGGEGHAGGLAGAEGQHRPGRTSKAALQSACISPINGTSCPPRPLRQPGAAWARGRASPASAPGGCLRVGAQSPSRPNFGRVIGGKGLGVRSGGEPRDPHVYLLQRPHLPQLV